MSTIQNLETDVVVVGGGNAGMTAAVSAALNGAKVTILEKFDTFGGAAAHAEGLFAIMTEEARMMSVWYTVDEVYRHSFEHSHGLVDGPVLRMAIEESTATIAWIKSIMPVTFTIHRMSPTEPFVWHVPHYKDKWRGIALIEAYADKLEELGVTRLMNTTGKKIFTENGKVTGLEALDAEGKPFTIKTRAVIIASGGFSNNKELVAKWTRFDPEHAFSEVPNLKKMGEGILMGMELGADTKGPFTLMTGQSIPAEDGNGAQEMGIVMGAAGGPGLWVDSLGDRFVDETVSFDFPLAANAIYSQRDHFAWSIWDEGWANYLEEKGLDLGIGTQVPVGTKLPVMQDVLRCVAAGNPNVFIADTIEELAVKIGIDPAHLKGTVDRYNGMVARHYDEDFFKDWRFMGPVGKGRFMAARLITGTFISLGGLRVTPKTEVIDKAGKPVVEGLFAAGADVGGLWGDTYEIRRAGAMMSWAATSGRIAGANAAALVKKNK